MKTIAQRLWATCNRRLVATLTLPMRFAVWRRESGLWTYWALAVSWASLTWVVDSLLRFLWVLSFARDPGVIWELWAASAALFVLLFEVGIAYVAAAAYASNRYLEKEGMADSD